MKAIKTYLVNLITKEAKSCKIVSLRETAEREGVYHIKRKDVQDIASAVLKALPGYKPMQIVCSADSKESLFCSLCFVDKEVDFEGSEE